MSDPPYHPESLEATREPAEQNIYEENPASTFLNGVKSYDHIYFERHESPSTAGHPNMWVTADQIELGSYNGDNEYEQIRGIGRPNDQHSGYLNPISCNDGALRIIDPYTDIRELNITTSWVYSDTLELGTKQTEHGYYNIPSFGKTSKNSNVLSDLVPFGTITPTFVTESSKTLSDPKYINIPDVKKHHMPSICKTPSHNPDENLTISFVTDSDYSGYPWADSEFEDYVCNPKTYQLPVRMEVDFDPYEVAPYETTNYLTLDNNFSYVNSPVYIDSSYIQSWVNVPGDGYESIMSVIPIKKWLVGSKRRKCLVVTSALVILAISIVSVVVPIMIQKGEKDNHQIGGSTNINGVLFAAF